MMRYDVVTSAILWLNYGMVRFIDPIVLFEVRLQLTCCVVRCAVRYWLSEGIIQQLMAKARELEKNADVKCKRLAERIFSGVEHVRTNVNS